MKRKLFPLLLTTTAILPALLTGTARGQGTPSPADNAPVTAAVATASGPAKGSLVIVGGGAIGDDIWTRFIELAGGKEARIVFVPTAAEDGGWDADKSVEAFRKRGAKEVVFLHTRDPKKADTDEFIEPLKSATGVWFGGGRQWRIADAYLGTKTQRAFESVLERGGVIGGTSAGATIQGSFLVRGDTKGNELLIGDHIRGFGYLRNVAIDQHLLRRNRQFDLISVIEAHPELLGIGIDEGTAVVVQGNTFEVIGPSYVAIYDGQKWKAAATDGSPGLVGRFTLLSKNNRFDLATRKIIEPPKP